MREICVNEIDFISGGMQAGPGLLAGIAGFLWTEMGNLQDFTEGFLEGFADGRSGK